MVKGVTCALRAEQNGAPLMADAVAHRDAAAPPLISILIAELKPLEPLAEQVANAVILQVDVDVGDVALAVNKGSHGKEEGRANHVGGLNAGVIVTVTEHGHLHEAVVGVPRRLKLLCEYRVRDVGVLGFVSAVKDHEPLAMGGLKVALKIHREGLDRRGVNGAPVKDRADWLYVNPAEQPGVVVLKEVEKLVHETEGMAAWVPRALAEVFAEFASFDFDHNPV